ncbi:hypothetical protein V8F33_010103 [Rhypophila sp. PSN 637]
MPRTCHATAAYLPRNGRVSNLLLFLSIIEGLWQKQRTLDGQTDRKRQFIPSSYTSIIFIHACAVLLTPGLNYAAFFTCILQTSLGLLVGRLAGLLLA